MKQKPKPIADRIREAFKEDERELRYDELMRRVFPRDQYPNAFRYQSNGGPPGCAMAFGAALKRLNASFRWSEHGSQFIRRVR